MADLWAFDFDGTLVETATLKREAFFGIFPETCADAVASVLARYPDGSRHDVIPRMVAQAGDDTLDAKTLVAAYGARVAEQVRQAPALPGAQQALEWAAERGTACLFSMTPHDELVAAITARGWDRYFTDIKGFPAQKSITLDTWIARFAPGAVTVIGDGESDEHAAHHADARFLRADPGWPQMLMQGVKS